MGSAHFCRGMPKGAAVLCSDPTALCPTQGSVYQKTNAMSEIKRVNKDHFWAKAEVRAAVRHRGLRGRAPRG